MDPLTSTICSLTKVVFESAISLYNFTRKAAEVDETVGLLYNELHTLEGVLRSLERVIGRKSDAWEEHDVRENLEDFLRTFIYKITQFHERLEGLKRKSGTIQNFWTQFKLEFRDEEIKDIRSHIQNHMSALNMILQVASVDKAKKLQATTEEINRKVDQIIEVLDADDYAVENPKTASTTLHTKYTRLRASIKVAASNMSESMGSGYVPLPLQDRLPLS